MGAYTATVTKEGKFFYIEIAEKPHWATQALDEDDIVPMATDLINIMLDLPESTPQEITVVHTQGQNPR
jgi:hypothetical protein